MKLQADDIEHIAFCLTLRERSLSAGRLWSRRGFNVKWSAKELAQFWIQKAEADPELSKRILSLYLEFFQKSGVSGKWIDCANRPERVYSTTLQTLSSSHFASKSLYEKVAANYVIRKEGSFTKPLSQIGTLAAPPKPPPLPDRARSLYSSLSNWAKNGLKVTDQETLAKRLEICAGCEFWDPAAFGGTGRCNRCGCSTHAKLRMASEKCPVDKWGAVA